MRVAIVFDGTAWFVQHIDIIGGGGSGHPAIYYCDRLIGGPFQSIDQAIEAWAVAARERARSVQSEFDLSALPRCARCGWPLNQADQHCENCAEPVHA